MKSDDENMLEPAPILWLLGPTSAGKTTLARTVVKRLRTVGLATVVHWDGDQVRELFGRELGFASEDRLRVVRALATLACETARSGALTVVSALTAHADARCLVDEMLPWAWIGYVSCRLDTLEARDPKGLYRRARAGEIDTLIGYNSEYPTPNAPDIEVATDRADVEECTDALINFLDAQGALTN